MIYKIRRFFQWLLSDRENNGAYGGPPNNWRSINVRDDWNGCDFALHFMNDSHEMWIYEKGDDGGGRWKFSTTTATFRRFALWYLWRWAFGEWFGLRRWLFYKHLHRIVNSWKHETPKQDEYE